LITEHLRKRLPRYGSGGRKSELKPRQRLTGRAMTEYSEKTTGKELTNKFTHDNNKCKECKQKIIDGLRQIAGGKRKIESLLKSLSA
jgi:hypothetical protein